MHGPGLVGEDGLVIETGFNFHSHHYTPTGLTSAVTGGKDFGARMQRRTLRRTKAQTGPQYHHSVYVVLLAPAAARLRAVRAANPRRDPAKPCVYVGMTGLTPEERFANHKAGIKAAFVTKRHGIRLLPELYAHLNPMPYEIAQQMERELAEDLRQAGYTVTGGY